MKRMLLWVSTAAAGALVLAACGGSTDETTQSSGHFKGKTISLIVPFSPGGGYDQYARQLAPKLADKLGAKVIVVNKPGAGGLLATNELRNAKPDGTSIGIFNMIGHLGSALAEAKGVQYKPEDFSYIGQISSEPDVVLVKKGGRFSSYDELVQAATSTPVRFAATGPGSNEYIDPLVLKSVLGLKDEVITGYAGGTEAALAVLKGDVDAHSRSLYSQLPVIEDGDAQGVLVIGSEPAKELPGVPTILDLAQNDEQKTLLEFHAKLVESGRAFAAPPKMDKKLLKELRNAFEDVVTDPAFMAAGEKAGRPVVFRSGADVQTEVAVLVKAPEAYVDIIKKAFNEQ